MTILTLRTDKPVAEIAVYEDNKLLQQKKWEAHRWLAETLHTELHLLLEKSGKNWENIKGICVFAGPGSFTGLRIGISVANALAYSLTVPIIAVGGDGWEGLGIKEINEGNGLRQVVPDYGGGAHITAPKK